MGDRAEQLTFTVHPRNVMNRRTVERQRRAIRRTGEVFQELFDRFDPEELAEIADGIEDAMAATTVESERAHFVREFADAPAYRPEERLTLRMKTLARSFAVRKEILKDSLTAPEVARLLGVSRQTPHDRVESGTLLAVLDRGSLRFPLWQFDANGPDGVVAGLPEVIRALPSLPAMAKLNWFVRPNPYLEGQRPIDALRQGEVARVRDLAGGLAPR
ncbi:MAG TPA: helix-turn-helix domain-containing protein [Chloroflexota bacterium]|nr:helix-turn-helix domain-containing protein [Chloroflexota bacterium]